MEWSGSLCVEWVGDHGRGRREGGREGGGRGRYLDSGWRDGLMDEWMDVIDGNWTLHIFLGVFVVS